MCLFDRRVRASRSVRSGIDVAHDRRLTRDVRAISLEILLLFGQRTRFCRG